MTVPFKLVISDELSRIYSENGLRGFPGRVTSNETRAPNHRIGHGVILII